ncbi:hypothetical protein P9112_013315 [Eukaryota sp. TZLM1-RC]
MNPIDQAEAFIAAEALFHHEYDPTLADGSFCPYCHYQVEACICGEEEYSDDDIPKPAPHILSTNKHRTPQAPVPPQDSLDLSTLTDTVANPVKAAVRRQDESRVRVRDTNKRATVEQVLDHKTRMMLFKLIDKGKIDSVNGVVSTGKEANVYHGMGRVDVINQKDDVTDDVATKKTIEMAVKVFKTSILQFKDREKYLTGDWRFRRGYSKHNSKKMVALWAEKEFRNLSRVHCAGIPSPRPIFITKHIILMEFIGEKGHAAPRLKDVGDQLSFERLSLLYFSAIHIVRDLWVLCKLVHGDYSEYNLLVDKTKNLVVIDVGQAVESDNPLAFEFLRNDLNNINKFFRKFNVATISLKELFSLVKISDEDLFIQKFDELLEYFKSISDAEFAEVARNDDVFLKSFIPQTLDEVPNVLRDTLVTREVRSELLYSSLLADEEEVKNDSDEVSGDVTTEEESDEESDCSSGDLIGDFEGQDDLSAHKDDVDQETEGLSRKERTKLAKQKQREKRQTKIPKHVKKRHHSLAVKKRKGR